MTHRARNCSAAVCAALLLTVAAHANPAHDQLSAMSEQQRRSFLASYLTKSGENCSSASKTFYQGSDKKGNAFWNVACTGGADYLIQINNDAGGSSRVLNCKVLKAVNAGTCFTKF